MTSTHEQYKAALAQSLGVDAEQIFLFWKGRVALYALLQAAGVKPGDEVVLPAFTCMVVPNAILYLGARPVYVDIDPSTYNMNVELIEGAITPRTRVILAQNTFGLSPEMDLIQEIATRHSISVIEDCTHGFGGQYRGKVNGTMGAASFFSTQWNKPFSTGIGGIACVNEKGLLHAMQQFEQDAIAPSRNEERILRFLFAAREAVVGSRLYWNALDTYRWLSEKGWVIGSSEKCESDPTQQSPDFLKGLSTTQAARGIRELARIQTKLEHQKNVAARYSEFFTSIGGPLPHVPAHAGHTYLRYPIVVRDRAGLMSEARRARVELGDWFLSPLHPITTGLERWQYQLGANPVAERICQNIVNLPTHDRIQEKQLSKILRFLEIHKNLLM